MLIYRMNRKIILALFVLVITFTSAQKDPHFLPGRNTIVHLFEWPWGKVAQECDQSLGPKEYAGVQVSPPSEYIVNENRTWRERYNPVSYKLITLSGNEDAFADMVARCSMQGIRVFVDVVLNHMSGISGYGPAGSHCDVTSLSYPAVPYTSEDFHPQCDVNNYNDTNNVRNCWLSGHPDLDQSKDSVRDKIVQYLNHLISFGVAGFRIDSAKYMWPADLKAIYDRLDDLITDEDIFKPGSRPFIYYELNDSGKEAVSKHEYTEFGYVTEFNYGKNLGNVFQGKSPLKTLKNFEESSDLLDASDSIIFIDSHETQRSDSISALTYKNPKLYKMAIAFMLAHPYKAITRIISSYNFTDKDQPPPSKPVDFNSNHTCTNGWNCENRWKAIYDMIHFRNVVNGSKLTNWWDNGDNQIAFAREGKGFIAFTLNGSLNQTLQTSLPPGIYCDVISGWRSDFHCTGKSFIVDASGNAHFELSADDEDGVLAIHIRDKL